MKKVIGAVVAGTLVAGMASADIAVKLNSRLRPSLYKMTETYANKGAKETKLWDFSNADHKDTLTFVGSGDNCGVEVAVSLQNLKSELGSTKTGSQESEDDNSATSDKEIKMDGKYFGWMSWNALKLTIGRFDSRYIDYYGKTAVEEGLLDNDLVKFGVNPEFKQKTFLYDFNNISTFAGNKQNALIVDYTIDADSAKILLKGGLVASRYKDDTENFYKGDDKSLQGAGYVAEVDVALQPANLQFIVKLPTQHQMGFGAYADVKAVENLGLAFGFTYGQQSEYDTYTSATDKTTKGKWSAWAFDARAFYKVSDPLAVGVSAKYSNYKPDGVDAETALELIGSVQYVASDLLTAQLDAGLYYEDLDDNDKKNVAENFVGLRPAVKINASKQAAVTAALECRFAINGGDADGTTATKTSISIPVIARVKL